jgi:hypothetical protein
MAMAAYLQSIELTAVDMYGRLSTLVGEPERQTMSTFAQHHTAYADALQHLAGPTAVTAANPRLTLVLIARLQTATDESAALAFAFGLENQIAATYGFASTTATSPDLVRTIATVVPTTAGRSAVLGALANLSTPLLFPNGPVEGSTVGDGSDVRLGFDPTTFPVG